MRRSQVPVFFKESAWPVLRWAFAAALLISSVYGIAVIVTSHGERGEWIVWPLIGCLLLLGGQFVELHKHRGKQAAPEPEPSLTIETGNGWPWDDPQWAPELVGPDYRSSAEQNQASLSELLAALKESPPATPTIPLPPKPVEGFHKKFKVTNNGPGKAVKCRVQVTSLSFIIDLPWVHTADRKIDLANGESRYLLLDFSGFTTEGDYDIALSAFANNLPHPVNRSWVMRVTRGYHPQVVEPEGEDLLV